MYCPASIGIADTRTAGHDADELLADDAMYEVKRARYALRDAQRENAPSDVVVGTGFSIAGTFSFVESFGGSFVGYFLDNGHSVDSPVAAQAMCAQSPGPPPLPITAAGGQTSADAAAEWARALADKENVALAEGLVPASTQVNVTTTKMP